MLASTVQFSSYDREPSTLTPTPTHHPLRHTAKPATPLTRRPDDQRFVKRYQPAATQAPPPPTGSDATRSDPKDNNLSAVPSGPNSVPDQPHHQ